MDVMLARVQRGVQVADVIARVRADTVEIWVGQCLEVAIFHEELLEYLDRPQGSVFAYEPIRFHFHPGQMSWISIGSRHHALADLEPLRQALVLHREARRARHARTGDSEPTSSPDTRPLPIVRAARSQRHN